MGFLSSAGSLAGLSSPEGAIIGGTIGALGSLAGGYMSATNSKKVAQMNINAQREFAQNGIQWRVEDAKKAGLHPLYAIGASGASYTPVSMDSSAMGNAVADAGAYLGKAVTGAMDRQTAAAVQADNMRWTEEQRDYTRMKQTGELANLELQNRRLWLDNNQQEMINARLASGTSNNPVFPSVRDGYAGRIEGIEPYSNQPSVRSHLGKVRAVPASRDVGAPLRPGIVLHPGVPYGGGLVEQPNGRLEIVPNQDYANAVSEMEVFGFNPYVLSNYWDMVKRKSAGAWRKATGTTNYDDDNIIYNGQVYRYNWTDDSYYPTGMRVK